MEPIGPCDPGSDARGLEYVLVEPLVGLIAPEIYPDLSRLLDHKWMHR
jgi:hypothetical protein